MLNLDLLHFIINSETLTVNFIYQPKKMKCDTGILLDDKFLRKKCRFWVMKKNYGFAEVGCLAKAL